MSTLVLLVELEIEPAQLEAFLTRVRAHRANVLKDEPGCERFDILTPAAGGNTVYLYEAYADQGALDLHLGTPYMKQYLEDTGPMVAKRTRNLCNLANG